MVVVNVTTVKLPAALVERDPTPLAVGTTNEIEWKYVVKSYHLRGRAHAGQAGGESAPNRA